ncbi:MAG: nucleobase:cation symporter-2 family protein [Ornithinimicrobium sp.]|uniref:nucleobase:cation symporter-2 family protein n=1 Tax=Ornithinimicrobium sp. TaxID=1977084 RepID=UPI0026DF0810|nr:nucleobase:cation symporter-2 family protein [Ornithinimicrobium sp.]MDO5739066.1 nucleobase:cation symporter-2 family protein [Ornithinimicrobium sp.]
MADARADVTLAGTHPVDEVLPLTQMTVFGLQHVLSMYAGVVAVPLIVGGALGLDLKDMTYLVSAALFLAGLATLLQSIGVWKIGARQPIVQGTSFVAVTSMIAIGQAAGGGVDGMRAISGAIIVAGVICFFLAPVFTMLLRYFPEVVTGTVITVIGLALLPVGINWSAGGVGSDDYGSMKNIGMAGATLLIIVLVYRFLPGFFSRIAILLGLLLGTLLAIPFGMVDFSRLTGAGFFQLTTPFHFGLPTFQLSSIIAMTIVMLVIMTETVADILAIGEVIDKPADRDTVTGGVRADMLSSAVAGVFNVFPISAFAQNVGLVAITGIRSRFVVAVGGVILIILGLVPVLGAAVAAVPLSVLGGAGIALFGTVAASGIRTLASVDYDGNSNLVIVAVSIAMGIIPIAVPTFWDAFPEWFGTIFHSGITSAAIAAVVLNAVFNVWGNKEVDREGPIFAEAPPQGAINVRDEERMVGRRFDSADGGQGRDVNFRSRHSHIEHPDENGDGHQG